MSSKLPSEPKDNEPWTHELSPFRDAIAQARSGEAGVGGSSLGREVGRMPENLEAGGLLRHWASATGAPVTPPTPDLSPLP